MTKRARQISTDFNEESIQKIEHEADSSMDNILSISSREEELKKMELALQIKEKELIERELIIKKNESNINKINQNIEITNTKQEDIIVLDVGGRKILTNRNLLISIPDTMLYIMFTRDKYYKSMYLHTKAYILKQMTEVVFWIEILTFLNMFWFICVIQSIAPLKLKKYKELIRKNMKQLSKN